MAETVQDNERHRIVMTAIIYNDEGKYLVTKRSPTKKVFPNKWTVPGGGLEPDDYVNTKKTTDDTWYYVVEKALRREVKEEVNVEIEKPQYLLDLVFIRPDGVPVLTLSYYAPYESGEVKLVDEEEGGDVEFRWVTPKEAKELDFISGIAEEIELTDRILRGEEDSKINL
jgi:8-oxo-dGTP pyrophosphatase MutT (NUDIX family)